MNLDEQDKLDKISDDIQAISCILFAVNEVNFHDDDRQKILSLLSDNLEALAKRAKKINALSRPSKSVY